VIPAICKAQHSEKDSIINAIEHLIDYLMEEYKTITFSTNLPAATVTLAEQLGGPLSGTQPAPPQSYYHDVLTIMTNIRMLIKLPPSRG